MQHHEQTGVAVDEDVFVDDDVDVGSGEAEGNTFGERISEMATDLGRMVSVEASVGPIALYAPKSRTASTSSHMSCRSSPCPPRVSFPSAVDEHERVKREKRPSRSHHPLPRIDSEKTLTQEEENEHPVRKLAKYKSADSGETSTPPESPREEIQEQSKEVCECVPQPEDVTPRLSKTRKILLGMVTMLNVLIAVSPTTRHF